MRTINTSLLLAALLIFSVLCDVRAQNSPVKSFATIEKNWRTTDITVKNGGKNPTVMELLKAFNAVWRTKAADNIIAAAGDKSFYVEEWYEGTSPVFVDNIDYCCAWYNTPGNTDSQNLETRTYLRENGHMLFAVLIEQNNPKQQTFCCFYDYNPKTQRLTPEDEPYKNMKRKWKQSTLSYFLGERFDQTVIVQETFKDESIWYHHYAWNGMKHEFHHVGKDCYAPEDEGEEEEGI